MKMAKIINFEEARKRKEEEQKDLKSLKSKNNIEVSKINQSRGMTPFKGVNMEIKAENMVFNNISLPVFPDDDFDPPPRVA
jgi:hypothetical protein